MIVSFSDFLTIIMLTSYSKPMPPHIQYRSDGNEVYNLTHLYLQFPPRNTFLYIPQMGIKPFLSDKLIVRAFFLYPSIVQDDYPVGILDCFEPVGNGNDGASFNQRVDGFLHLHFIFWVASSNRITGASFSMARAMDMRCFSPPDKVQPPSPTIVS